MQYRVLKELSVLDMHKCSTLPRHKVMGAIKEKRSGILYLTDAGVLWGIVTFENVAASMTNTITIKWTFALVKENDELCARKMLLERKLQEIPVIDSNGILKGELFDDDVSRFVERNLKILRNISHQTVYHPMRVGICLVVPNEKALPLYEQVCSLLTIMKIPYSCTSFENACANAMNNVLVFADASEMRCYRILSIGIPSFLWTYKDLFEDILSFAVFTPKVYQSLLCDLQKKGVKVLTVTCKEEEDLPYFKYYHAHLENLYAGIPRFKQWEVLPACAKDFFGELYSEEYYHNISSMRFVPIAFNGGVVFADVKSRYLNIEFGERVVCNSPKDYLGTIHFFGACICFGQFVEDKHTIASFLQNRLNIAEYAYRVVNHGTPIHRHIDFLKIMEVQFHKDDIALIFLPMHIAEIEGIKNIDLGEFAAEEHMPYTWTTNTLIHCNYKANEMFAKYIYQFVSPNLQKDCLETQMKDIVVMPKEKFLKETYINTFFSDIRTNRYKTVGAIVMNCNPFTKGHRYLIEMALKYVEVCIVFVVEENQSLFTFEERMEMVKKGCDDLEYVFVRHGGAFIISQRTFPEYFRKIEDDSLVKNINYDLEIFAKCIAPPLHITARFIGEEPNDNVTKTYNELQKKVLVRHGIHVFELPRLEQDGGVISASRVRGYMERGDLGKAMDLLPQTSKPFINLEFSEGI